MIIVKCMKISKDTPAFLRYFNARFKPFTKPIVWCSLGGLLIGGLAIYQYWQHPEWLQTNSESLENSPALDQESLKDVSQEDLAAAANLDNVDLLVKEIEQNSTLSAIAVEQNNQSPKLKREDSAFSRLQKAQKAKLKDPSKLSSATGLKPYSVGDDSGNQKIMELLKPPSFSSYESNKNSQDNSFNSANKSQAEIIPNPVGNIYLENRTPKSPQAPITPATPTSGLENSGVASTNNLAPNNNSSNNLNQGVVSTPNGQNVPVDNSQPVTTNGNNLNGSVPASALIQPQQIPPINSYATPSTTGGFNSLNPYSNNSLNSNSVNGINPNPNNSINSNPVNGINSINNNPSITGTVSQPVPNTTPGLTTTPNNIGGDNLNATGESETTNSLQNNYRSFKTVTPSYNRSTPTGYQSQPQNYSPNGFGQSNNGAANINTTSAGVGINSNNFNQQAPSSPTSNNVNPSLQPSGVLSTSEIGR